MDATLFFRKTVFFFFEKEKVFAFEDKLFLNGSRMKNLNSFLEYSLAEGILLMILFMGIISQALGSQYIPIGALFFFAPFLINYLFHEVLFERRKIAKEKMLPDLLLEASVFYDETSLIGTIKRLSDQDFQGIEKDFQRAFNEIKNGASIEEALERIKELNKSSAYSRAINLLLQGYSSGAKMANVLKEAAEDLLETQAILSERQALTLVNKYTLILASGLIVPTVLGLIIGLVSGLSFESMGELALGLSAQERKSLYGFALLGTNLYITEYALLSSAFLSLQDGNKKQFWVYAGILLPTALAVFNIAKGL